MNVIRSLRHAFLVALGSFSLSHAQGNLSNDNKDSIREVTVAPVPTSVMNASVLSQQASFDFAFGDQTAASLKVRGATGQDWGVADTYRATKKFIEQNPGALKGKNVFIAIGDGGEWESFWYGPKLATLLQNSVGSGKIVVMGLSETRTDINGVDANNTIRNYITKRKMIYGGPLLNASSSNNVYPVTAEAFKASTDQARANLDAALNAIKTKVPVANKASPRN